MIKYFICGAIAGMALLILLAITFVPVGTLFFDYRDEFAAPLVYAEFPKRVESGTCKLIFLRSRRIYK